MAIGELDLAAAPAMASALSDGRRSGNNRVILDLSDVTFLDCAALRVMLRAREDVAAAGGWLRLAGPSRVVRRLLGATGTAELFLCVPTSSREGPHRAF